MGNNGFTLIDEKETPSYGGRARLYLHEKTGFKVVTIDNKDNENFFSYIVYTPCKDSSGVFHIIEHTVLSGSKKYPVKDAFTTQMTRSCPTFMNAMTGADRTYYLAASAVKKDFENLFAVYSDAVFSPLLRKETFMQEGIRVSFQDGIHFDGVVFSEMQGATSQHESVLSSLSSHSLFPGCAYEFESGGLPKEIARLSYEEYLETYKKFYVPSNMCLLLYGNAEKKGILKFLNDEYLAEREYVEPPKKVVLPERWSEPRKAFQTSSSSDPSSVGKASILYSWRLNENSAGLEGAALQVLTDLLVGSPGCPLYSAITECPYAEDISTESGMIWDYSAYAFSYGAAGVKKEDYDRVSAYLLEALKDATKKGFSKKEVEAALRRNEFNLREISGGNPQGMKALFRMDKAFAYGQDMLASLFPEEDMKALRDEVERNPRFFEEYIEKNFISNPHRLLSIVEMDDKKDEEIEEEMALILEEEAKKHTAEEDDEYIAFSTSEDSEEDYKNFKRLTLEDLDDIPFENNPGSKEDNNIQISRFSNGIVYLDAAFDVSDFTLSELESLNVYTRLLTMCSTKEKAMSDVQTDLRFNSGGYAFYLESGSDADGRAKVYFLFRMRSLSETAHDALVEFVKLLKEGLITAEEVKNALTDISTDYKSGVIQSGHSYAISASGAPLTSSLYIGEKLAGLSFWYTIEEKRKDVEKEAEAIKRVREKLLNRNRIKVQTYHDEANEDLMRKEGEYFLSSFDEKEIGDQVEIKPDFPKKAAFLLSSPVSYSSASVPTYNLSFESGLSARTLLSIISNSSLWDLIRAKGGAYGTGSMLDAMEKRAFFYTYRDPRGLISFSDFSKAIEIEVLDDKKLEDAKILVKSADSRPQSPSQKALNYLRRRLFDVSDEYRKRLRKGIMAVTLSDVIASKTEMIELLKTPSLAIITDKREEENLKKEGFEIFYLPL